MSLLILAILLVQDTPLRVAADIGFAPHVMVRPDGRVEGFNVDLAAEIATRLNRPGYEIIDSEWSGMFAGLNATKFEFVIAPTTATPERARMVLFTEGYLDTNYMFLVMKQTANIVSLEDLRGKTISVNNGSAYDVWSTKNHQKYGFEIQRYGKNADAIQAVLTRRAFANLAAESVVSWAVRRNPQLKKTYTIRTGQTFAMAFRKSDINYRNRVEGILECLKQDGTLARIHNKWLGKQPQLHSATLTISEGYGIKGMPGFQNTPHSLHCP